MKKTLAILTLALALTANAAALEIPTDTTVQNLNGNQQMVKTYTLPPDADPAELTLEPTELDGYTYTFADIVKQENRFENVKPCTETVTVETEKGDLGTVLEALAPTKDYQKDGYSGTLALDHTSIQTKAAGYAARSYPITETKELPGLGSNDLSYVPATTMKGGVTLTLSNVEWRVQGTSLVDDVLVPSQYTAVATYSGTGHSKVAAGYLTTADYMGEVTACGVKDITYTLTYLGAKDAPQFPGFTFYLLLLGIAILATLVFAGLWWPLGLHKNVSIYIPGVNGEGYEQVDRQHITKRHMVVDLSSLLPEPAIVAIEIKHRAARKLVGRQVTVLFPSSSSDYHIRNGSGSDWVELTTNTTNHGTEDTE